MIDQAFPPQDSVLRPFRVVVIRRFSTESRMTGLVGCRGWIHDNQAKARLYWTPSRRRGAAVQRPLSGLLMLFDDPCYVSAVRIIASPR
ncbi:MAG: hypothetical protein QME96_12685 [Myxococcota bacterium]|nr:hypothetical protein [Myxococcota bacterium]